MKATDEPVEGMSKAYASVSDMIRDTCDVEFADDFDKHLSEHGISKILTVIRCARGMTQGDVATKMGTNQAKVSRMERTADSDLNFGDIAAYTHALGQAIQILFMPARATAVDHIRYHVNSIKHELERLVDLAGNDRRIGDGVEKYAMDNVEKYVEMIESTLNKLPHRDQQDRSPVSVEVEGERGERFPIPDTKRRVRKANSRAKVSSS
jgi:hypothetical protein